MNDDDKLLSVLRDEPLPPEAADSDVFFARFGRELDGAIDRKRSQRRLVRVAFAVAAVLAGGLAVERATHQRSAPVLAAPVLEVDGDDDEANAALAIEDFTDEEVARAIRVFPKGS